MRQNHLSKPPTNSPRRDFAPFPRNWRLLTEYGFVRLDALVIFDISDVLQSQQEKKNLPCGSCEYMAARPRMPDGV